MDPYALIEELQQRVRRHGANKLRAAGPQEKVVLLPTLDDLRLALKVAMSIELSTIPLYSYALYSIPPGEGAADDARAAIRGVLVEEMLHVSLAANLLTAAGELPQLYSPATMPSYPVTLKLHKGQPTFNLTPATYQQVHDCFMAIEEPAAPGAPPEFAGFETLGQLYEAIAQSFIYLSAHNPDELFANPRPTQQLTKGYLTVPGNYWESGHLVPIADLKSALLAINFIVQQGEGIGEASETDDPTHFERSHYRKFQRIWDRLNPLPAEVVNLMVNPHTADYPPAVQTLSDLYNAAYCYCLLAIDELYRTADGERRGQLIFNALMPSMNQLMARLRLWLTGCQVGCGADGPIYAGPTYERFQFEQGVSVLAQLEAAGQRAVAAWPENRELAALVARIPQFQDLFVT